MSLDRRNALKAGAALAVSAGLLEWSRAWAAEQPFQPEPGAKLRFLRWSKFLDAENKATSEAINAFSQATGVEVRIENEWQDDIQTKAAVAVNVGSGPDIVWTLNATAHLFPDKLLDVTDVADYLGRKYGGWYQVHEVSECSEGLPRVHAGEGTVSKPPSQRGRLRLAAVESL